MQVHICLTKVTVMTPSLSNEIQYILEYIWIHKLLFHVGLVNLYQLPIKVKDQIQRTF